MLKKDKIFVFFIVLFSVCFLSCITVFASTESETEIVDIVFPDIENNIVDQIYFANVFKEAQEEYSSHNLQKYFVMFWKDSVGYLCIQLVAYNSSTNVSINNRGLYNTDGVDFVVRKTYRFTSDGIWRIDSFLTCDTFDVLDFSDGGSLVRYGFFGDIDSSTYVFNENYRVLNSSGADLSKLFQVPFQGEVLIPIIQATPLEGVLQEIVEILPIVLMTIVGLIGLRKGLQMLSAVLHRS